VDVPPLFGLLITFITLVSLFLFGSQGESHSILSFLS
jgi:hypothetical protein